MSLGITLIIIFLVIMLLCHSWYDYQDNGKWPWKSKNFWKFELKLSVIVIILLVSMLAFIDKTNNRYWFWEARDFYACEWGLSADEVIRIEDLTGRPSGTMQPPQLEEFGQIFSYLFASPAHFKPITRIHIAGGVPQRAYFFENNFLFAGCTYSYYRNPTNEDYEKFKQIVEKNNIQYGDPIYSKKNDNIIALIWNFNKRSYHGLILTSNYSIVRRNIFISKKIEKDKLHKFINHFINLPV